MCQLLGTSCNRPTQIYFLWSGFQRRGGHTDTHSDGWGLSFFEGNSVRLFMDENSCCNSSLAQWVKCCPFKSNIIMAHIRRATEGTVELSNTHPFVRELWGRNWVFAHNGTLKNYYPEHKRFFPIGDTDSERAFCWIMDQLAERFPSAKPNALPDKNELLEVLLELTTEVSKYGVFNYILSYGEFLIARCASHLHYTLRQAPFGVIKLLDDNQEIDLGVVLDDVETQMAVIATQPLTNEHWLRIQPGVLMAFENGKIIHTIQGDPGATPGVASVVGK
ncbi:MAG: class II glutamine amidotransferase [Pseudomonadota bacterium]